jgi:uncharacterized protein (TIRG00374 family)
MGTSLALCEQSCQLRAVSAPPEASQEPVQRYGRRILVAVLMGVVVFAGMSMLSDVRALGTSLKTFRWSSLGIALALVLGNYAFRFVRWQYYLRVLQVSVPLRLSALAFLSGFMMGVTPGKMGEVFKSMLLSEYRGIRVARTASVVVAERLLDLVALVTLVSLGSTAFAFGRAIAISGVVVVALIVVACTAHPVGYFMLNKLENWPRAARIAPKVRITYDALQTLTRPTPFFVGGLLALLGWSLECIATWFLVQGFGVDMSFQGATFAYAAGTLAGALAMLPGGLGVAEVGMSGLFCAASPGLPIAVASAATILVRLSTLWFGVAVGALALLVLRTTEQKEAP